jgi:hypothetical protein
MPTLTNTRHEAFAQARFRGLSVMDAYREAGYEGEAPQTASKVSQNSEVKARLMELHNAAATVMAFQRLDLINDLVTIIKASPSEAAADHPLCEVHHGRQGKYHRFPPKLRAMARLIKIMAWDEPDNDPNKEDPAPPRDTLKEWLFRERNRHQIAAAARRKDPPDPDAADEWHEPGESSTSTGDANPSQATPDASGAAPVPVPLSPKQEAFAQARFAGMGVMEAYRAAGYHSDCAERASRVSRHPAVKARLAALRKAAEDALPYKRYEAINDLIAILHASPAEADPGNSHCEMRMSHSGPYYRFPCKLAAILLLVRLMRWHEPEKVCFSAPARERDTLKEFCERVTRRS